ncbi:hypothetical protein EV421DRAFT_898248 [Armillaria borealis]|uniref:Uncharacterized protein n=1 Tax=Armillaria borealis TaxID=47425 RepID=A0AA39N086_9AGAR|nr:hypothetical protein EV421DRAFT_898248 [Armillaria borealis]
MTTHRRASVPPIPDLRFETAYLRKIRPFVHFEEARDDFDAVGDEQPAREVLEIDWKNVFWVTVPGPGLSSAFTYGQYTPRLGRDSSAKREERCRG